ncbi:diacylglycerol kinase family protein [Flavilitoribacter nigricans]|uniref:Diacylglycerol kinase n=1 Tax=Flavilitoribacter nigricans (strain ATCC 23147 / DSM 23189 / NBRC 102662 / NCIMB 1420 / SS-2) TaxID=1122177 RepID=A0A2D0NFK1_FLAN2|nr:diacylglycerol kinase family protein [Flavilitoribacter nigricans]PHN07257.1 diacylglycerol kinase [Flavilitoribacter nigricans DSM 23189 = NBRC 102662]
MKRLLSFKYAFQGLGDLFRTQPNARIHLAIAVLAIALGIWLGLTTTEWALICLCIGWVLAAEAFNTAIEYLTDLVSPDFNVLAGKAKDAAAAAVLLSAMGAALTGLWVLGPPLWRKVVLFF